MLEGRPVVFGLRSPGDHRLLRRALEHDDVVPVPVVLREVAEAVLGVPEQILAPGVRDARDHDAAQLESNDLPALVLKRSCGAERDRRRRALETILRLLQDGEIRIARVEYGGARRAHDRLRELAAPELDGRAALRTVEPFDTRDLRPGVVSRV